MVVFFKFKEAFMLLSPSAVLVPNEMQHWTEYNPPMFWCVKAWSSLHPQPFTCWNYFCDVYMDFLKKNLYELFCLKKIFLLASYACSLKDPCLITLSMPVTNSQEAQEDGEASIQWVEVVSSFLQQANKTRLVLSTAPHPSLVSESYPSHLSDEFNPSILSSDPAKPRRQAQLNFKKPADITLEVPSAAN